MRKVFKRFTALFLALVLSISILPLTSMAEEISDFTEPVSETSTTAENTSDLNTEDPAPGSAETTDKTASDVDDGDQDQDITKDEYLTADGLTVEKNTAQEYSNQNALNEDTGFSRYTVLILDTSG